jgi:hypothetical protein
MRHDDVDGAGVFEHALGQFCEGFSRTSKGNLWRRYGEGKVCVFGRRDEDGEVLSFKWLIDDGDGKRWADQEYETEEEALQSVWFELEGWEFVE